MLHSLSVQCLQIGTQCGKSAFGFDSSAGQVTSEARICVPLANYLLLTRSINDDILFLYRRKPGSGHFNDLVPAQFV